MLILLVLGFRFVLALCYYLKLICFNYVILFFSGLHLNVNSSEEEASPESSWSSMDK